MKNAETFSSQHVFLGDFLMKTPKFFFAPAMDYLGRNGDKGQVMQMGGKTLQRNHTRFLQPLLFTIYYKQYSVRFDFTMGGGP